MTDTTQSFDFGGSAGAGSVVVGTGGSLITGGAVAFSDIEGTSASVFVNGGSWTSSNQISIGTVANGALTISAGGAVNAGASIVSVGATGSVSLSNGNLTTSSLSVAAGVARFPVRGTVTVDPRSNSGVITASGGLLKVTGSISGSGSDTIANASTLEANGILVTQSLAFGNSASNAAIQLDTVLLTTRSFGINNWQMTDELIINNGSSVTGQSWTPGAGNTGTLTVTTTGNTYTFSNVTLASAVTPVFTHGSNFVELISCFAAGTLIETAAGPIAVEDLSVGDAVLTADDETIEPVIWIGHRTIDCASHPHPDAVWPVRIRAGAFGAMSPSRDLFLSPDHAVFVNGVLVPVKLLINEATIRQIPRDRITYFHIELPRHAVILAEQLPVESYLDTGDRAQFSGGPVIALYPDFVARTWEMAGCAELVTTGARLEAARASLAAATAPRAAVAG